LSQILPQARPRSVTERPEMGAGNDVFRIKEPLRLEFGGVGVVKRVVVDAMGGYNDCYMVVDRVFLTVVGNFRAFKVSKSCLDQKLGR
jgi:hypothetical protein